MKNSDNKRALNLKWHSVYGQILFDRVIEQAWKKVAKNKGAGGIDGVTIDAFKVNEAEKLDILLQKLRNKEYRPTPVRRVYIPKKNGDRRPLGIPNLEDRIVQQALVDRLQPKFEEHIFHKWSCGYRPNVGVERAMQIILWNIESGYNYIYDADIKGFFDNIPHKKMMGVLNQYVADGTVLDLIWKWMKVGYMEEGKHMQSNSGTPQGGVISPLLANVYLNELDWDLADAGIRFVRYADDFLLFARTKDDVIKASEVAKATLRRLGLEISTAKTKYVDFNDDDFDFLGFTFGHWRKSKKGETYFLVKPHERSLKDFKKKIKDKTNKNLTLNKEVWVANVNPTILGKTNYYLTPLKAIRANEKYGQVSRCRLSLWCDLREIDHYIRRRLRVCMIHKHPSQRKGMLMTRKWKNEFFFSIGLVSSHCKYTMMKDGIDEVEYIRQLNSRYKRKYQQTLKRATIKGVPYYTEKRNKNIQNTIRVCTP